MKFLADENIAFSVIRILREEGFNVKVIVEEKLPGITDKALLQLANKEERIVLTHDKDLGNLFSQSKIQHKGIILLRFKNQQPRNVISRLLQVLKSPHHKKFAENLTIVTETQIIIHTK